MNTKRPADNKTPRKLWRVFAFKRPLQTPVNTFSKFDEPQVLTGTYLVREELGDIVLAPGYSNDEIIGRRLLELAELRDRRLCLEFVDVVDVVKDGERCAQVAINSTVEEDGDRRYFSSICPFCDTEMTYNGLVHRGGRQESGFTELYDADKGECKHFSYVDADPDVIVYVGDLFELGRPGNGNEQVKEDSR
jgi:hypothetical protein